MNATDLIRLRHMRDAALESMYFLQGRTAADLQHDRMLALALVKELEIIGEAASKVSVEVRALAPAIPWTLIVGMRNRLIHAYFDVSLEFVWNTGTEKLPQLIAHLNTLLRRLE